MALRNTIDTTEAARRLTGWLGRRMPGASDVRVSDVTVPAASGLSTETVLFRADWTEDGAARGRGMVARVQPDAPGVFRHYDLAKEARVMRALAGLVAVPEVLFTEDDPAVLGAPFLVMARVDGRIASDDPPFTAAGWVLELSGEERARLWDDSLRTLAGIHSADWRGLGLDFLDTAERGAGLAAQLALWERTFTWAAEGEPNPTIESALEWLRGHPPEESGRVLNWGDARVGNLIVGPDLAVAAVLDWEMVTLGSRELDLGWWLFLMRHHTEGIGLPLPSGVPTHEQTVARYRELTGHEVRDIHYWEVFAGTRLAIIMVRAAHMMISAGLLPPDATMAVSNPAVQLVAGLLDLPEHAGERVSFIGNR
jgi:aminoglycoside phosphotransferase (APT) family kinase protein